MLGNLSKIGRRLLMIVGIAVPLAASAQVPQPQAPAPADVQYVTLPSGLQYSDVKVGTGPSPQPGQNVTVHYTGTLMNGQVFDSSRTRGKPFTFVIGQGQVIKGWDEGVMSMKVGGRRLLRIPADLAYGDNGAPPVIPPNATLNFDVELLSVQ